MQAVLNNTIKLVKNNTVLGKKLPKEVIPYLLKASESADNKARNDIENQLVKIGEEAIPVLLELLETSTGSTKALISMVLIRLGKSSIEPLRETFKNNEKFGWIVDYIVNEIQGSQKPLQKGLNLNNLQEILVG